MPKKDIELPNESGMSDLVTDTAIKARKGEVSRDPGSHGFGPSEATDKGLTYRVQPYHLTHEQLSKTVQQTNDIKGTHDVHSKGK